jgi:hypothetical protein
LSAGKKAENEVLQRPETSMTNNSIPESYTESEISNPDEVPNHMKFVNLMHPDFNIMLNHTESTFQIRKHLIEVAIKLFPHLLPEHCTRELLLTIF